MTWTTLIGFDGSDGAHDALALGPRLTPMIDAEIVLGVVYGYHPLGGRLESSEAVRAEAHRARGADEAGGPRSVAIIPARSPVVGLHELADIRRADLLVVGCSRVRGGRLAWRSGVSDRLASGCRCPVAVAPVAYRHEPRPVQIVGCAFDDSSGSHEAVAMAAALAGRCGAALRVYVAPQDAQLSAVAVARAGGKNAGLVLCRAGAATGLRSAAEDVDVLVLPADAPAAGMLRGGAVTSLVRRSARPVVVVPRGSGTPAAGARRAAQTAK